MGDTHRRNRAILIAAIFVAAILGLALIVLVGFRLYLTEERAREIAEREADELIEGRFTLDDFSWVRFPTSARVSGVVIRDPEGREVLTVGSARLDLAARDLGARTIRLRRLEANDVVVRLFQVDDEFTITRALASRVEPAVEEPWDVVIEQASITGGRIEMEIEAGTFAVEDLEVERAGVRWENGVLTIELDASATSARWLGEEVEAAATSIRIQEATLDYPEEAATIDRISADRLEAFGAVGRLVGASASYRERRVGVEDLLIDLDPGSIAGGGMIDLSGPTAVVSAALDLTRIEPARIAAETTDPELWPARVDGTLVLSSVPTSVDAGEIEADLVLAGMPPALAAVLPDEAAPALPDEATVEVEATLLPRHLQLDRGQMRAGDVTLTASGLVPLEGDASFELDFTASHQEPGGLLAALDNRLTATSARIDGTLYGALPLPGAAADLLVEQLTFGDAPPARLTAPLRLEDGTLFTTEARLESEPALISATGRAVILDAGGSPRPDPEVDLDLRLLRLELSALHDALEGVVQGEARVRGTVGAPVAEGQVYSPELGVDGVDMGEFRARASATPQAVRLTEFTLTPILGGEIEAAGVLDIETLELALDVDARRIPIELGLNVAAIFAPAVQVADVEGLFDARARLRGPLEQPRVEARLASDEVSVRGVEAGELTVDISGDMDRLAVAATIEGEAGELRATGDILPYEGRVEGVRLLGDGIRLEALPGTGDLPVRLAGSISVDLVAEGDLPFPELAGRVEINELTVDERLIHRGRLIARIGPLEGDDHAIGVQIPGALFVRARVSPGPPLEIDATADIDDFDIAWLLPAVTEAEVSARLQGTAEVRYLRDPPETTFALLLSRIELSIPDEAILTATRPATIRYDGETLVIEDLELEGPYGRLQAGGAIGPRIDALAVGRLDMALVAAFVPQIVSADGAILVDIRATGTLEEPSFWGRADLVEKVRLLPRGMIRDIVIDSFHVQLTDERIDLEQLRGGTLGGPFEAEGFLVLDGVMPERLDISFTGEGLPLRTGDLFVEMNADVRLTGEEGQGLLSGRVDIVRGRYKRELRIAAFSLVADDPAVRPPVEPHPLLAMLRLDLRVLSIGAVDARLDAGSFGLDLVLDADLRVFGPSTDPALEGRIEVARGELQTPQADLPITRGVAVLVPVPGQPVSGTLDVVAEGEVIVAVIGREVFQPTHFVSVGLEGDLDELTLELTSQPSLDRLEVLSLLVTGGTRPAGLVPGDARHVESAMVLAGTRLAEPLTRMVTERLEDILNLDLLVARVTLEGIAITAGTEISRRLRLEGALQQGFGDAGALALARAQFLLSNMVYLEASTEAITGDRSAVSPAEREGQRSTLEIRARVLGGR